MWQNGESQARGSFSALWPKSKQLSEFSPWRIPAKHAKTEPSHVSKHNFLLRKSMEEWGTNEPMSPRHRWGHLECECRWRSGPRIRALYFTDGDRVGESDRQTRLICTDSGSSRIQTIRNAFKTNRLLCELITVNAKELLVLLTTKSITLT